MEERYGRRHDGQAPVMRAVGVEESAGADGALRVIMTADNHLSAYTPRLSPQRLSERRKRLREAFSRVVDAAIDRRAHLFIQAGDLFDSTDPRNFEREFVAAQLARLRDAGIRAFGISGNHDTPRQRTEHGGYSPQGTYARLGGIQYFPESHRIRPTDVQTAGMRVAVAGLSSNPGAAPGGDPLDGVEVDDPDAILARADLAILVLHAAIEGHGFPSEDESIVRRASLERLPSFGVVLAGHVHAYARFQVGGTAVVICGPTERMEFGEAEDKPGFAYLELTRAGLRHAEHVTIPPQPRHVGTIRTPELWPQRRGAPVAADSMTAPDADSVERAERAPVADAMLADNSGVAPGPTQAIITRIEPYCTPEAMVRLCLDGPITREQYRVLDLRTIWLAGQNRAFSFELDESNLFLTAEGSQERIARGERIAPHDTLDQVAREWMDRAETHEERMLLAKTREQVLASYAHLMGREAGQ